MKKAFAVLAVLALAGFGSLAIAAEGDAPTVKGNIEIYGAAKLSVDVIKTDTASTTADKNLTKVSSNSSRIGFKGTEDLGDGMSAVYQLELGVNMDGTTTTVSNATTTAAASTTSVNSISLRNTYAGLKHNSIGMLFFGTHDTPYKLATGQFDPFTDTMGDYNCIIGNVNGAANFDLRAKDVIAYASPSWAGVQVMVATVQTGQESSNGLAGNPSAYSASVTYGAGPLAVGLAYETHKNGVVSGWDSTGKMKNTGMKLGAGYTISDTRISLVYESIKDENADSAFTRNAAYVSVTQTIGKEKIKLAYGQADDGENPATKTGATLTVIGVDHAFSKRTTVFLMYAKINNDDNATYGLGVGGAGGTYVPAAGENPSAFSFGIVHTF